VPPPLTGLRVLDLSRNVAGPLASMFLGDMGADVVKVEGMPRGDEARYHGPPFIKEESPYFLSLNRNKRSVAVDLRSEQGHEVLRRLSKQADIILNNFRPGVMESIGLSEDEIRGSNAGAIVCNITGFGQDGPWVNRPAYDHIIQGMSGLMSLTGQPDSDPVRVGVSICDVLTGYCALAGILAALHRRQETGEGDTVNVSLLAAALSALTYQAGDFFATGESPLRRGNEHPMIMPYGTYRVGCGESVNLAVGNHKMFSSLADAIDRPELATDSRFASNALRVQHRAELTRILEEALSGRPASEWVEALSKRDVACGPVLALEDVFRHPQVLQQELVKVVEHPDCGPISLIDNPVRLGNAPLREWRPPPAFGEHSQGILEEAGYSPVEVAGLRALGITKWPARTDQDQDNVVKGEAS
jgi:crotonobetainyl-CoA:carnitine CoA-transferase CaiB-like acyl-CoA transferase